MRHFHDFPEAQNEIRRDLNELGVRVVTESMQHFEGHFATKELTNYSYQVLNPDYSEIDGVHVDWVKQEWADRVNGDLNPGSAWRHRRELWRPLMEDRVKGPPSFSYTYSERMGGSHITRIIEELKQRPHSRQLWLPVWYTQDERRRGQRRVPCSLGYYFLFRNDALNMTYVMRSCDMDTHFPNDICLATMLLDYVAEEVGMEMGTFTHDIFSFHVYEESVIDAF